MVYLNRGIYLYVAKDNIYVQNVTNFIALKP